MAEGKKVEEVKKLASYIMHKHYCENDVEAVTCFFSEEISWIGAGENEYLQGAQRCREAFSSMKGAIPRCNIWDEEYHVISLSGGTYVVSGRMWIATDPSAGMYLKVHQRVTFMFQDTEEGLRCSHIHCSNPYEEMVEDEKFPEKIGKQSYAYVEERIKELEEKTKQQNRQLEVVMSSIAGGMKISRDDDEYSYVFVSKEAAALFGYTVEEFMQVTGGTAIGNVYPPDLPKALADCRDAFSRGKLTYSTRYRVKCKDGSIKWIMDSGKKSQDAEGNWMVNSLYLDITQSEERAQRLREQSELLASIYDTVPCGIIRFVRKKNGEDHLISLNKAVLSLVGYDSAEEGIADWNGGMLGNVLEEDRRALIDMYEELERTGERQVYEYRAKWKDGSIHWIEGSAMIVGRTPEGEPVMQRTGVDITARKCLQHQLDREQEMYRVSMEASSAIMFEYRMDTDTFITYEPRAGEGVLNHEWKQYTQLLERGSVVHPDDVQKVLDNICQGRSEVFEMRSVKPGEENGQFYWYRVDSRRVTYNDRSSRIVGTLQNIHSIKSELSENEERLFMNQSALQAVSDVYVSIYYVDLVKDWYYAVRLPGNYAEQTIPRTGRFFKELYDFMLSDMHEMDKERVAEICSREWLCRELAAGREYFEVEFRRKKSDLWLRMEVHLMKSGDAETKTAVVAYRNISIEKQKELEYFEEEKKAKQALEEAYKSVNRANQAKSEFLSRMSHDIRTPMNAIMGMTAIARNSLERKEKVNDCLAKISISGRHLLELINEVLDMSKIESGNVSLMENKFSLHQVLEDVSQMIRPETEQKNQEYTVRIKQIEHDRVLGDEIRLKEILINLLSNAVKYTLDKGHISITLEEKLSSKTGVGCFEFIIEDDGIGMSEEFLERLFRPFERAQDIRMSHIQGSGLGLAITQNLVQMMNGSVSVESKINEGTVFSVVVYLKLEEDNIQEETGEEGKSQEIKRFLPGTTVLLAEDNELNQEIIVELLSMCGIETICAGNGREAVERFKQDPEGRYGLILMDIQMPELDGYGAARAIRKMGETGQRPDALKIPIIALTANAFVDDIYKAKQAGMNEHVTKPLDIKHLAQIMHRYLD